MLRVLFDCRPRENLAQGGAARRVRQCSMLFTIRARILRRAARLSIHYTPIARHYGSKKKAIPKRCHAWCGVCYLPQGINAFCFTLLSFFFFFLLFLLCYALLSNIEARRITTRVTDFSFTTGPPLKLN